MSRLTRIGTLALLLVAAACDTPTTPPDSFGLDAQYVFLQGDISIRDIGQGAAMEVSPSGRVVGSTFINGVEYAATLVDGQFVPLDGEPGRGFAVNARGQLTGGSHRYPPLSRDAFLFSKGTLTGFGPGNATDLSDRGEVVGFTRGSYPQLPWVWRKGVPTFLPLLPDTFRDMRGRSPLRAPSSA